MEQEVISIYRDRFRILLILYYFSEGYHHESIPDAVRLFKGEIKIQKIDFLLRNPDYLAYELMELMKEDDTIDRQEIQQIVKIIFATHEPVIRKEEMKKLFFGAYEDIDNIISFLCSINFLRFESSRRVDGKVDEKRYYLTKYAIEKIEKNLKTLNSLQWYFERCEIIKRFFGDMTGTELKVRQYKHSEYSNTLLREYIASITEKTKEKYKQEFGETLDGI